ncbi:transcriptional regulator family: HMG [Aspergillus niger]|nr:transcriptional regulator family: HMG [Aspergillus niger]
MYLALRMARIGGAWRSASHPVPVPEVAADNPYSVVPQPVKSFPTPPQLEDAVYQLGKYSCLQMCDRTQAHANTLIPEKGADADQTKSEPLRRHSRLRRSNRAVAMIRNDRDDYTAISRQDLDLPCLLSALTTGIQHIPVRDICAWAHRPVETRRQEARQRQGRIPRPPNPFMLYRLAYSDRAKHWLAQNDDRAISILTGRSWTMEALHIRKKYKTLAVTEKQMHAGAHPGYRFSPSTKKRRSQTA